MIKSKSLTKPTYSLVRSLRPCSRKFIVLIWAFTPVGSRDVKFCLVYQIRRIWYNLLQSSEAFSIMSEGHN